MCEVRNRVADFVDFCERWTRKCKGYVSIRSLFGAYNFYCHREDIPYQAELVMAAKELAKRHGGVCLRYGDDVHVHGVNYAPGVEFYGKKETEK